MIAAFDIECLAPWYLGGGSVKRGKKGFTQTTLLKLHYFNFTVGGDSSLGSCLWC